MSYFRDQLESYLKTLDIKADIVFDVGGLAKPVKDRVKSWDVKDYRILDLPEYDLNRLDPQTQSPREEADVAFCLEVMEYIYSPNYAMLNLMLLVKKGGTLYITFPFVYPHHNPEGLDSLRYTEWGARKLLEQQGFIIEEIIYRTDRSGLLKEFYAADGMRASKEYRHHEATGFIVKAKKI